MKAAYWHSNKPHRPSLTRPALALRYTLIEEGKQGQPARYAMDAVCDDGVVRTFIVGGKG